MPSRVPNGAFLENLATVGLEVPSQPTQLVKTNTMKTPEEIKSLEFSIWGRLAKGPEEMPQHVHGELSIDGERRTVTYPLGVASAIGGHR